MYLSIIGEQYRKQYIHRNHLLSISLTVKGVLYVQNIHYTVQCLCLSQFRRATNYIQNAMGKHVPLGIKPDEYPVFNI